MQVKTYFLSVLLVGTLCITLQAQTTSLYVSDAGNFNNGPWQILKFDENGDNGEVFISDSLAWPQDIVFLDHENTVLISNLNTGIIAKFSASTGEYIEDFATGIGGPTRMEIGADSLLYVLQWQGNGTVWRYQLDGTFVDEFTSVGVPTSIGLAWDVDGNLYVSSFGQRTVRKFDATGQDQGLVIDSDLAGPTNIWFAENGDLMVCDWNGGDIKRFDSSGNLLSTFIDDVPQVEGVDFFPNGNIVVGVGGTASVRLYDSTGTYLEDLIPPGTLGLLQPNAVVLHTSIVSSIFPGGEEFADITLVTPSIGQRFQFSEQVTTTFESDLAVYNSSGKRIAQLNLADSTHWDAAHLPVGTYFIVATLKDGGRARQKVVVQR